MEGNLYRAGINLGGHFLRLGYLLGRNLYRAGIRRRIFWAMVRVEFTKGNSNLSLLPKEVVRFFLGGHFPRLGYLLRGNLYRAGIILGGHFLRLCYLLGGESVQDRNKLGRALSETRLPFGEESVQGGNQEEDILCNGQGGIHERELEPFASRQGSSSLLPEEDTDVLDGMDGVEDDIFYREIVKIKGQSCSMGSFATKLVQKFFHSSELENRNCMGSRGEGALRVKSVRKSKTLYI